jgi:hypothetical protein
LRLASAASRARATGGNGLAVAVDLDRDLREVDQDQRPRRQQPLPLGDRQPFAQACAGLREVLAVHQHRREVVEAERDAGGVAELAVDRERAPRQVERLVVVAERVLDQREVVEHRGRVVGMHARRPRLERRLVMPARVLEAPDAQRAGGERLERLDARLGVAPGIRRRVRRLGDGERLGVAVEPVLEVRRARFREHAQRGVLRRRRRRGRLAHQRQAVLETTAHVAEAQQRHRAARDELGGAGRRRAAPGGAQVLEVDVDGLERVALAVGDRGPEAREQAQVVLGVRARRAVARVAVAQPLRGELLDQRVQRQPRAVLAHQRLVGERAEDRQRGAGHRARRVGREAAAEHRQPREHVALGGGQVLPRLVEHDLDARLARGPRRVDRVQELGAFAQLVRDRLARQDARPRRGELERERQALDAAADVEDRGGLGRGHERRLDALRGAHEQAHRVERLEAVDVLGVGPRQPRERQQPFARQREPHARRHDELHARARLEDPREDRRVGGELLEVVERDQHRAPAKMRDQPARADRRCPRGGRRARARGARRALPPTRGRRAGRTPRRRRAPRARRARAARAASSPRRRGRRWSRAGSRPARAAPRAA